MKKFFPRIAGRGNRIAALLGTLALLALAGRAPLIAAEPLSPATLQQIRALVVEKESRTPAQKKMDSQLVYALRLSRGLPVAAGVNFHQVSLKPDPAGRVLVDLDATVTEDLLAYIRQLGGEIVSQYPRWRAIRTWVPVAQTEALAARFDVKFMQAAVEALVNTGSVNSQGDRTHRADEGRTIFGATGAGTKVGVLSDSVDFLANSQATGDLPPVTILPGQSGVPGSGEGTAMLEIIYDLAPGAELYFATAFAGPAGFAQNIVNLRAAGCDVIVDDVFYFNESPFQDGVIARAVNQVTEDGALFFSSAGNSGSLKAGTSGTWEGDYADGGAVSAPVDGRGGQLHLFGTNTYNTIVQPGFATTLFWSDPLGASTNDYDLFILDATGQNVIDSSTTVQNGAQDPYELARPSGANQRIVVVKVSGDPRYLHIDTIRGRLALGTAGNTKGHSSATNAYSTAATDAGNSYPNPFVGGGNDPVESFSSDGPRHVFYQADGTPITPGSYLAAGGAVRDKPDITAADGVATAVPGFNPFYGTSAAAPHAAAIAALLLSYNDLLTPADMRVVLTNTALDTEGPGYDINAGAGIVMAYPALQAAPPPLPKPNILVVTNVVTGGNGNGLIDFNECNQLSLILTNAGGADATTVELTLGTPTPGVAIVQPRLRLPSIPAASAVSNLPPFEVSTALDFVCGTPIDFTLVIKSDQVTRTNQFRVETGKIGTLFRFDSLGPVPIPDFNPVGAFSPTFVTNIGGAVGKVAVSLHLTHTYLADLNLELIAPDGTTNLLAAGVGGSGDNFGLACSPDSSRTVFDDDATNLLGNALAPFVGLFRPQQPLTNLKGRAGTNVNGLWQLRVVDNFPLDSGVIQCWSLLLYPAVCADGGGACPGVDLALGMSDFPDPVVLGSNLVYTLTVTNFGPNLAKGAVVTHNLPASVVFVSATTTRGTVGHSGGVVTANLDNLPVGATATIRVTVLPALAGTIISTATATSVDPEINPPNNVASQTTLVLPPSSDLAVSMSGAPNPTTVAGPLNYTVVVVNNGPATASGVLVSNTLPASVIINGASASKGSVTVSSNIVTGLVGVLTNGETATVSISTTPFGSGTLFANARVLGNQPDPVQANNVATVATVVGQTADLAISLVGQPNPVVLRSNFNYFVVVTNRGPNAATSVAVSQALPASGYRLVSTTVSQGSYALTGGTLAWNAGSLAVGATASMTVTGNSTNVGTITSQASVNAAQADLNPADNTASAATLVAGRFLIVAAAGAAVKAESFLPPNGAVDLGETVTLDLRLRNAGNVSNTNLVATLLPTGGVGSPSGPQTYGVLSPGGLPVSRSFTFTAGGTTGGAVTATLQLSDGPSALANVTFTFPLARLLEFRNPAAIAIPAEGKAAPYPSTIAVSGVTGTVGQVTVTLSNLNHTFAEDVDVLLVGPLGQSVVLMAGAGRPFGVTDTTVTFDDAASQPLPPENLIENGAYQPTSYNPSVAFPGPAPAGPYGATLSQFAGLNPAGTWSLFVVDHQSGDAGSVSSGWSLAFAVISPVNRLADLGLRGSAAPSSVDAGESLTLSYTITNAGPDSANGVAYTNDLPANLTVNSANSPQGTCLIQGAKVVGTLDTINAGGTATVTIVATASGSGAISSAASVVSSEVDLNPANNSVTVLANAVLPRADLAVGLEADATSVVVGSNVTFTLVLTNAGPNAALAATVTDTLPAGFNVVSVNVPAGSHVVSNGTVICSFGKLVAGASATATLVAQPLSAGAFTNTVVAGTQSQDDHPANNAAAVPVTVTVLQPRIVVAGAKLLAESQSPANGVIDPGETVTVTIGLKNVGQLPTASLVATLMSGGGVLSPGGPQTYGALAPLGAAVWRAFTFTAGSGSGGLIHAVWQLNDGPASLDAVTFSFSVAQTATFVNAQTITIPDRGAGTPYPSTITVSGVTGVVGKATVTLNHFSHGFPDDVDALLVGPQGQKLVLLSDAGGGWSVTNLVLTFDDAASALLPDASALTSGVFKPTDYEPGESLPLPAPKRPYTANLSTFGGTDPNGVWSLYVADDTVGDLGVIAGGWSLTLSTAEPLTPLANLLITAEGAPGSVVDGASVIYTLRVTNQGPAAATGVTVVNTLPIGASFVSAATSQGSVTNDVVTVTFDLGPVAAGASAQLNIVARLTTPGIAVNTATVSGNDTDLDPSDDAARVNTTVETLIMARLSGSLDPTNSLFTVVLTGHPGETYALQASTDLLNWVGIQTNVAFNGQIKFSDTNAPSFSQRYYRAMRLVP